MKRPMIRSMIRPMIRPMISGGGGGAITRYYALTDSVLNSHLVYANTLVFGAGDTYEFDFLAPTSVVAGDEYLIDGDVGGNRAYLALRNSGEFLVNASTISSLSIDGVNVSLTSLYPLDGKLHKAMITLNLGARIGTVGARYTAAQFYKGILANAVATISGVTTSNEIGEALLGGNDEQSVTTGPANHLSPFFIPDANIEQFQLSGDETQWDNISPLPQELPAVIEIA